MDLIGDTRRLAIRGALQNVFDTFCKTDISLLKEFSSGSRGMEDFSNKSYSTATIKAYVEYPNSNNQKTQEGSVVQSDVKIMIGIDDLSLIGFVDSNSIPKISKGKDYVIVNNSKYIIEEAIVQGAFENRNIYCLIYGNISKNYPSNGPSIIIGGTGGGTNGGSINYAFTNLNQITYSHYRGKYVDVTIIDQSGNEIEGEITQPNTNTIVVKFDDGTNLSGTLIIN